MNLNAGAVRLKQAEAVAANKTQDSKVVLSALSALFSLLSAINGADPHPHRHHRFRSPTAFMFRERMLRTQKEVSDASVLRFG